MLDTHIELAENERAARAATASVGDVVTLKSGGPRMTVMDAGPAGFANGHWLICQWFDEHGELRQDTFAPDRVHIEPRLIPAASVKLRMPSARANRRA
ncbi:MAG: YodC family protein [Paraburkholderia sp.]|jgi:uncharacterized protein YodC (DUF2158 family)|nr:YodC family protein [Paraburkholderia sp.]